MNLNYDNAEELLKDYDNAEDVPEDVLKQLNIDSRDLDLMMWFDENYGSIKAGHKDNNDWEEDNMNLMNPEGDGDDE
ncbi:MAG: hypothetical protein WCP55_12735 [Lentisphaerota bacterium]